MKKILFTFFALVVFCNLAYAKVPDFGANGLKGLTDTQKKKLDSGEIIFSTSDSKGQNKNSLIQAVVVFDKTPQQTWGLLHKTENQDKYLKEIDDIDVIEKSELVDKLEFKLKVAWLTYVYRVIHRFDETQLYLCWGLDETFKSDLTDLRGYWKFYPYGNGKTLARYGSNVAIKNIPSWVEGMFKKNGVKKSLNAVKRYVNSGGKWEVD